MSFLSFSNIASAIGGGVMIGLIGFGLHSCEVNKIEAKQKAAIVAKEKECKAEKDALSLQCYSDKLLTQGADNGLQNGLRQRDIDLSSGVFANTPASYSIFGLASPSSGIDAATKPAKPNTRSAINGARYKQFAASCEGDRLTLIDLQKYVCDVWISRKQISPDNPLCKGR